MKKTVSVVLTIALILCTLFVAGSFNVTAAVTRSGKCGDNLTWEYDSSTYTLTISGTGEMYNYSFGYNKSTYAYITSAPWGSYYDQMKTVVIANGVTIGNSVTSIGDYAFRGCSSLTSVTIGNSVTSIGAHAFEDCKLLKSINIPNSVTSIRYNAFSGCSSLTSVTIGNSVTSIGSSAFQGCSSLYYNIYDNAKYLGNADNPYLVLVKATSTAITSCNINKNTKVIYPSAFSGCSSLTSINIPDSVTSIGSFKDCSSLTSVTIGNSVTSIDDWAFDNCSSLTSITIPNSVTSIGEYAFRNCSSLTSVTIPDSVTSIGSNAFYGCSSLNYNIYDNAKYLGNADNPYLVLVKATSTDITSCNINKNTKVIAGRAFSGCSGLTSVTIPNSVTSISEWAFHDCSGLTNIIIPNSVTRISEWAFSGCSGLTKVVYCGTEDEWSKITIYYENNTLTSAARQYHLYDNENDTTCNICGHTRTVTTKTYPDVMDKSAWYYNAVMYVSNNGIFSGYANGKFGVADNIQRQDFIITLARYSGESYDSYKSSGQFKDVSNGAYYTSAVIWGAAKGIVSGYENGKFGVGDKVTREQLVLFLYRYAKYKGYKTSVTTDAAYWKAKYSDFGRVSGFAKDAVIWALEKGVISGKQGKYIDPQGNAQRCEVAKIFYNIDQNGVFKK